MDCPLQCGRFGVARPDRVLVNPGGRPERAKFLQRSVLRMPSICSNRRARFPKAASQNDTLQLAVKKPLRSS